MPDFERVAQWVGGIDFHPGARFQVIIVLFGQLCCAASVARQQFEKFFQPFFVPTEVRQELLENRPEFFAKSQHTRGKEVGKRRFDIAQLFHVCDKTRAFNCENKIVWCLRVPPLITRW